MSVLVWCPACRVGYGAHGRLPTICPSCLQRVPADGWLRSDPVPKGRWSISRRDWFFLMVLGIDPEREHCNPPVSSGR